MRDIIDMIRDILRAKEENKLAIFVGSGVSANSGYKSWWQIVDRFNENGKYINTGTRDYTDEEILKIPQYAFNESKEEYFKILEEEYNRLPDETNPIVDLLVGLRPNHIITTNYDRLIEFSIESRYIYGNTLFDDLSRYSKVINDSGFVSASKPHYLIKMHGDLEDRTTIVLKEDDYLEFSSNHSLMEIFVKSLFVNHTILFVGYGLRDHNLKLILSWVNSFAKKAVDKAKIRKHYYINVESNELSSFENDYYNEKNIFIFEASRVPESKTLEEKENAFDDCRGKNLFLALDYIFYRFESTLDSIAANLALFDNMNAITPYELYTAMNNYVGLSSIVDGIEYGWVNGFLQNNEIISELQSNPSSSVSITLKNTFLKAGIKGFAVNEKEVKPDHVPHGKSVGLLEIFWMQPEPQYEVLWLGDTADDFYHVFITHDFSTMMKLQRDSEDKSTNQQLKLAYIHSYLWEDDDAKIIYNNLEHELQKTGVTFNYAVVLYNLHVLDFDSRFHVLRNNMADRHKKQFHTLLELHDGFSGLMRETIATDNDIRKMLTVNAIKQSSDLEFTGYRKLRETIHQTHRYFIDNHVLVKGLGGSRISKQWFDLVEIYLDMTLRILSPNSNMAVSKEYKYKRIQLTNEDIFFITFYLKPETLRFYLNEHRITTLDLDPKQQDYLLTLISNLALFTDLPEQSKHSQLANLISCVMIVVEQAKFDEGKMIPLVGHLEAIIVSLLSMDRKIDYTFFSACISNWISCLYGVVRKTTNISLIQSSVISIVESTLLHFASSNTNNTINMGFQIKVFEELGLLINLSNLLEYYFHVTINDETLTRFLSRAAQYEHSDPNIVADYIIELFPAIPSGVRGHYQDIVQRRLPNLEMRYLRRALESGVILYDSTVEMIIMRACDRRIRIGLSKEDEDKLNDPLYIVLRLHEKGIVGDLSPYCVYRGHYDFFDFVCFPEEFDYSGFDTSWGSWLTLEKYSSIAVDKAFNILKLKYEEKMQNAPTEGDRQIYYKFFHDG